MTKMLGCRISWLLVLSLWSLSLWAKTGSSAVEVGQAVIFLPQANAHATGSKMTIYNRSNEPLVIKKVTSDAFKHIMLHQTKFEGGQRVMYPIKTLTVDPHQKLAMTPNTVHIMLMGFKHPLQRGELIPLILITNQGQVPVVARVAPMYLRSR